MVKALHASLAIVALAVGCAQDQVRTDCNDNGLCRAHDAAATDETSLLQLLSVVKNRTGVSRAKLDAANSSAAGAGTAAASNLMQHALGLLQNAFKLQSNHTRRHRRSVPFESHFDMAHVMNVLMPTRADHKVLLASLVALALLGVGWSTSWLLKALGRESRALKLVLLVASFSLASWGMNVINKSLIDTLRSPTLMTAAQMVMTAFGSIILTRGQFKGSPSEVVKWSPVSLLYFGILLTSYLTYKYLTLSMLMVVKGLGPLIILPLEACVIAEDRRPYVTWQMVISLVIIVAGSCVYCYRLQVSLEGLVYAVLNLVLAIADRAAQRRLLKTECCSLSSEACGFLNNLLGLVPALVMGHFLGEFGNVDWHDLLATGNSVLLLLSGIIGAVISMSAMAVQQEVAATSFMVLQNVVRLAVVAAGVSIFHDPVGFPFQVLGLTFAFFGAFCYGKALIESKTRKLALKEVLAKKPTEPANKLFAASTWARHNAT